MMQLRKPGLWGIFLWLILFAIGFGIGWQQRVSKWNQELEMAADELAARQSGLYVPEFQGAVFLDLPPEPTGIELEMIKQIREH